MHRNYFLTLVLFFINATFLLSQTNQQYKYSVYIRQIFDEALKRGKAYDWLEYLSNTVGGRLSGSKEAALAVAWGENVMRSTGATVEKQECMVPRLERGNP